MMLVYVLKMYSNDIRADGVKGPFSHVTALQSTAKCQTVSCLTYTVQKLLFDTLYCAFMSGFNQVFMFVLDSRQERYGFDHNLTTSKDK